MDRRTLLLRGCAFSIGLSSARAFALAREPVVGGPCEGCGWAFEGMPATLAPGARIASPREAGMPLVIDGVVSDRHGKPAADVIVYAYHTDNQGIYPRAATRHGALRGWARTDSHGHYRFETIRPRAYPARNVPEHVHMHVIEPGAGTYYIDELRFADDPLLTAANRRTEERGGTGLVMPARHADVWHARRDVSLGRNIPGYANH
jgi:hypothetical protein